MRAAEPVDQIGRRPHRHRRERGFDPLGQMQAFEDVVVGRQADDSRRRPSVFALPTLRPSWR